MDLDFYYVLLTFIVNTHGLFLYKIKKELQLLDRNYKFHKRSMKSWLEKNDIEINSAHNEGKSVVAEQFIIP